MYPRIGDKVVWGDQRHDTVFTVLNVETENRVWNQIQYGWYDCNDGEYKVMWHGSYNTLCESIENGRVTLIRDMKPLKFLSNKFVWV